MTNIIPVNRLSKDEWSVILSFIDTKPRFHVAQINKETQESLRGSFAGECIYLDKDEITDAGLKHLKNVEKCDLSGCHYITNSGLAHLKNVKEISLNRCRDITWQGLEHLKNMKKIDLHMCMYIRVGITNADMKHLKNVEKINLSDCHNITDAGLAHLVNAKNINLTCCYKITDAGKQLLKDKRVIVRTSDKPTFF